MNYCNYIDDHYAISYSFCSNNKKMLNSLYNRNQSEIDNVRMRFKAVHTRKKNEVNKTKLRKKKQHDMATSTAVCILFTLSFYFHNKNV